MASSHPPSTEEFNVVDHRPTQAREIVVPHRVERAVEHDPSPVRDGDELQRRSLESTFPFRLVRHLERVFPGEGLDDHRPRAGVARVSDGEGENVNFPGGRADDLCDGALFPGDEFDGAAALRDGEVVGVDVFNGFERFYHPSR